MLQLWNSLKLKKKMPRDYFVGDLKIRNAVFTGSRTLWIISRKGIRLDAGLKLKNARRIALKILQTDNN